MNEELTGRRKLLCKQEIKSRRFNHRSEKEGEFTGLLWSHDEIVSMTGFLLWLGELTYRGGGRPGPSAWRRSFPGRLDGTSNNETNERFHLGDAFLNRK